MGVHAVTDVQAALVVEADLRSVPRHVRHVEPEGIEYRRFVRAIAERLGRRCVLVPLPFAPALAALRVVEALRLPTPVSSDNLLGLRAMRPVPPSTELEELGVAIRSALESLDDLLPRQPS